VQPPKIADVVRPEAGMLRLARSASAALVCTVLASGAHLTAGGRASPVSVSSVFLGTWAISAALAGRRLTTSQLVGLLMFGQAVTHVVSTPAGSDGDAAMLAAHVAGTALSAVLLRKGEDALWTLADRMALRAAAIISTVSSLQWRPSAALIPSRRTHRLLQLIHVIEGRGPPTGLA
jgi:hypothetical protein